MQNKTQKKTSPPNDEPEFLPSYLLHLTSLVLSHAVVVAGLGEHAAGDLTRLAVLDGDSLDGGRCAQRDSLAIDGALSRRHGAVGSVVDLCAVRTVTILRILVEE